MCNVLSNVLIMFGQQYKTMLQTILKAYGLNPALYQTQAFGSGLINHTWKISGPGEQYILQRINKNVFKRPQDIADNLHLLESYLKETAPGYIFAAPLPATNGQHMVMIDEEYYRLLPFVPGSHTVDFLTESEQAYEAAREFGKFTCFLKDFEAARLKYTLIDFHNLSLRVKQFYQAFDNATADRKATAAYEVAQIKKYESIAEIYERLVKNNELPLRVIHHDTKISNILFDDNDKGLCVIDLDTVMPGYFISDVGDMMRTYLSAANEEERDLDKISVRTDFFAAIYAGYAAQMGAVLTPNEKSLFIYAGKFMIYMQAVRFLADFLNGDIYYPTQYPGHNLMRAKNQLRLLEEYIDAEPKFNELIYHFEKGVTGTVR